MSGFVPQAPRVRLETPAPPTRAKEQRRIFAYSSAQEQTEEISAQLAGCRKAAFK
jgi:hypothetical protein